MKPAGTAAHVHPFPIRAPEADGVNSVFTQEAGFTRDDRGRLVAPFSCFPPFRGESPFVVARGQVVLTDEAWRRVEDLGDDRVESLLADAIRKKLPAAKNGEIVIESADLVAGTSSRQPA
jgi:hypothetical protein